MNTPRSWTISTVLLVLALSGCASQAPPRKLSTEVPGYAMLPDGKHPLTGKPVMRPGEGSLESRHGRPLQVLTLSGGGQNGAFGAGVLTGWRESGARPKFDVVTGISTGALIATFAYLGEPQDDKAIGGLYTDIGQSNIYRSEGFLAPLLFGHSALMDTSPMKALIDKHITTETLARVAAEHAKGRMLMVGATNLDRNEMWVFLLSALASEGGPAALATFRNILYAAASPPVLFPPVEIFGYLFADGATIENLLIAGLTGRSKRFPPSVPKGQVWVIHNGRLSSSAVASAVSPSLFPIVGRAFNIAMDTGMGSTLVRAYSVTSAHAYGFNLVEVPEDVEMGDNAIAFDHKQMVTLFDAGRALGRRGDAAWVHQPPATPQVSETMLEAMGRMPPLLTE